MDVEHNGGTHEKKNGAGITTLYLGGLLSSRWFSPRWYVRERQPGDISTRKGKKAKIERPKHKKGESEQQQQQQRRVKCRLKGSSLTIKQRATYQVQVFVGNSCGETGSSAEALVMSPPDERTSGAPSKECVVYLFPRIAESNTSVSPSLAHCSPDASACERPQQAARLCSWPTQPASHRHRDSCCRCRRLGDGRCSLMGPGQLCNSTVGVGR